MRDGPYAVPMHYTVMDGQIYLHCAKTGYKLDAIARDDRVCFTVTLRENWSRTRHLPVRGVVV